MRIGEQRRRRNWSASTPHMPAYMRAELNSAVRIEARLDAAGRVRVSGAESGSNTSTAARSDVGRAHQRRVAAERRERGANGGARPRRRPRSLSQTRPPPQSKKWASAVAPSLATKSARLRGREADAPDRALARARRGTSASRIARHSARDSSPVQRVLGAEGGEQRKQRSDAIVDRLARSLRGAATCAEIRAPCRRRAIAAPLTPKGEPSAARHRFDRASRRRAGERRWSPRPRASGSSLNVASVTRPSVPCAPQLSLTRSRPVTFFITRPPQRIDLAAAVDEPQARARCRARRRR